MNFNHSKILIVFSFFFFSNRSFCQTITGIEADKKVTGAQQITLDSQNKAISSIRLKEGIYSTASVAQLSELLFGNNPLNTWQLIRSENDQLGMNHLRYQQLYRALPVEGNVFIYHAKNGFIQSANGDYEPNISLSIDPKITSEQAMDFALAHAEIKLSKEALSKHSSELIIFIKNHQPTLAYKISVLSLLPHVNKVAYVDAINGKILTILNKICTTDVIGIGHTQFSGIQPVTTDSLAPTNFVTVETSRGNGIQTLNTSTNAPYADLDNVWNNVTPTLDEFAMDVHFGAEATYDFYFNQFNRNSYDNAAGQIINYVNDETVGLNAYWSGAPDNTMHYGQGDTDHFPVTSLEIAGHELTHGVTEYSAGLMYSDESGALNESFSDIFGVTIRFLNAPSIATWFIGDQLLHPNATGDAAFRNMADPNQFQNADCYNGLYFNNGDIVHYDSGIQNFWYYLLCSGGTGVNDLGNNYAVAAIGMNDAMTIAYRNLAFYLTPSSTFMDARLGSEQAAIDLFGLCSPQHLAVIHAWYAVGVGANSTSAQVNANFTISENFACVAPLTTTFTANVGYENYAWDFGDGTTSTLPNPSHTYVSTGSYSVTLVVSNTSVCPGTDTEIRVDAIEINPLDPVANFSVQGLIEGQSTTFTDLTTHTPTSWQWDFGDGSTSNVQNPSKIYALAGNYDVQLIVQNCAGYDTISQQIEIISSLTFCTETVTMKTSGVIYDSGGESNNYQNNENCDLLIQPCNAASLTFQVEELNIENNYDFLIIYDGSDATAPVLAMYTGTDPLIPITTNGGSAFIEFSSDNSITNSGFKIRYSTTPLTGSPSNTASFWASTQTPLATQNVSFTDNSFDNPIAWSWNFGDGSTSILQNPTHYFALNGTYTVTLTVTFCNGNVSSQTMLIHVGGAGIAESEIASSFIAVFPNPSHEMITIQNSMNWSNITIELLDLAGRKILSKHFPQVTENGINLSTSTYAPGNYLIRIQYMNALNESFSTQRKLCIE